MNAREQTQDIVGILTRLLRRVNAPRVLGLQASAQGALTHAVERARTQLLDGPEPVLVVALVGCTGAGKSALTNALAGAAIAEVSHQRPTTTRLRVYHHRAVPLDSIPVELAHDASFVPHDRPDLYTKIIIDTPDLDSFATQHRALTKRVLQATGLALYVFSPEKYLEERTWSVLREEFHFSASAAVLNKADRVSADELEEITADLRERFTAIGMDDIPIFRTCALAHVPQANGVAPPPISAVDETFALRKFLEHELQATDIARMRRAQHQRVVTHLREEMERIAPATTLTQLENVTVQVSQQAAETSTQLMHALAERLKAVEREFAALATMRQHERFHGPLRTWLVGADCIRFGLTRMARHGTAREAQTEGPSAKALLSHGTTAVAADALRQATRDVQNLLYAHGLPVERWRSLTEHVDGDRLVAEIAGALETRLLAAITTPAAYGNATIRVASTVGRGIPTILVLIGLCVSSRDLLLGHYVGLPLLGHLAAIGILSFLALQGLVNLLLPNSQWENQEMEQEAVHAALVHILEGWLETYRNELAADLADLHEPLALLEEAVALPAAMQETLVATKV